MWVGTAQSNVYKVSVGDLKAQLMTTCHCDRINDITYPQYAPRLVSPYRIEFALVSSSYSSPVAKYM